ncbi:MAG: IPT/TIG domain-containing protein [Thermoanaerobaculales bacterium]|nr:IPT/TIG domain-containing protein [Thermoanaerobaculales bacterium]
MLHFFSGSCSSSSRVVVTLSVLAFALSSSPTHADAPTITPGTLSVNWGGAATTVTGTCSLGDVVSFDGTDFLPGDMISSLVTADGQTVIECALELGSSSTTTVTCVAGLGLSEMVVYPRVTVSAQTVTSTDTYHYPTAPVITGIQGCPDNTVPGQTTDCPVSGGVVIDIMGENFPPVTTVSIDGTFKAGTFVSSSHVQFELPPGSGEKLSVRAFSDCLWSGDSIVLGYAAPQVTALQPGAGCVSGSSSLELDACPRIGEEIITVLGEGFTEESGVLVGGQNCTVVEVIGSQTLSCILPMGTGRHRLVVNTAGQISTAPASIGYMPCLPGTYAPDGVLTCSDCAAGTFASGEDSVSCTPCPIGYEVPFSGAQACMVCGVGTAAPNPGSVNCGVCSAGFFASGEGAAYCEPCPPGQVSDVFGASACTPCDAGTYQPSLGQIVCFACPAGQVSGQGFPSCVDECWRNIFSDGFESGNDSAWSSSAR